MQRVVEETGHGCCTRKLLWSYWPYIYFASEEIHWPGHDLPQLRPMLLWCKGEAHALLLFRMRCSGKPDRNVCTPEASEPDAAPAAFAVRAVHAGYGLPHVDLLRRTRRTMQVQRGSAAAEEDATQPALFSSVWKRDSRTPSPMCGEGDPVAAPLRVKKRTAV